MFECQICFKDYTTKWNLKRHIEEKHAGLESYKCTEVNCRGTFIRREYLYKHLTLIHKLPSYVSTWKSINANRKQTPGQHRHPLYEDVSDDDSI